MKMNIVLGKRYKEMVHGRKGIAVSKTEYLTGCARVSMEYLTSDGEVKDFCVDEIQLVEIPLKSCKPGGPGKVAVKPGPVQKP